MKPKIKREVVCVYGKWGGKKTDFVLEPVCGDKDCEYCEDSFWIEEVKGNET